MKIPTISIILPAYNAQNTLEKAIASVQGQTFTDWELLVVNDGSTDNTRSLAERYAGQDARIRVITQPNGGRSAARNTGLAHARGEYMAFLDADDMFLPNTLQDLYDAAQQEACDLVIGEIVASKHLPVLKNKLLKGAEAVAYLFSLKQNQRLLNSIWNKLFKRSLVTACQLQFPDGVERGEDLIFVLSYVLHINTLRTVCAAVYNYLPQENSITRQPLRLSHIDRQHRWQRLWIDIYTKWRLPTAQVYGSFFTPRMFGCSRVAKENPALLREIVRQTFADRYLLDCAQRVQDTAYDNIFARLLRGRHVKIWTGAALLIGIIRRIMRR